MLFMYTLNLKYFIYNTNDIIYIKDEFDNKLVCAISLGNINFSKFETIMYKGFDEDIDSKTVEGKAVISIFGKYPLMFDKCTSEECSMRSYIRNNLITFKESFITKDHFIKIQKVLDDVLNTNKKPKIAFVGLEKFNHLIDMLEHVPIIDTEIISINNISKCDLNEFNCIIINEAFINNIKEIRDLKCPVISINVDKDKIDIGPIIFTENFEIPDFEEINDELYEIKFSDQGLVFFFIERILFVVVMDLYNEINIDMKLPIRNKLTIDKKSLAGKSEYIFIKPKNN